VRPLTGQIVKTKPKYLYGCGGIAVVAAVTLAVLHIIDSANAATQERVATGITVAESLDFVDPCEVKLTQAEHQWLAKELRAGTPLVGISTTIRTRDCTAIISNGNKIKTAMVFAIRADAIGLQYFPPWFPGGQSEERWIRLPKNCSASFRKLLAGIQYEPGLVGCAHQFVGTPFARVE
jgi:hypothetical protein